MSVIVHQNVHRSLKSLHRSPIYVSNPLGWGRLLPVPHSIGRLLLKTGAVRPVQPCRRIYSKHTNAYKFSEVKKSIELLMKLHLRATECHLLLWDHTCHPTQVNTPHLNPSQTGRYSIYLPGRDGRLSWPRCQVTMQLHTEMVYIRGEWFIHCWFL